MKRFSPIKNYLFRPGGAYNCAIARMVIASALWLTIIHNSNFSIPAYNWDVWLQGVEGVGWTPKGLVKFTDWYFDGIPPGWTYWLAFEIARISIICMAVGIFIPVTQILATLTTVYCVSLQTSFGPYWSHAYNVQLLAACAFMFARSSDVWSADAWIRKVRGHAAPDRGNIYWWPVIFAELATALFMFGAFYQKFRETGFFWALSDNIRNSLGITWFQYRADMPEIAYWIASEPFIYKTAGMMQLFIQSTTIIACFLLLYPVLRLIMGGAFLLVEILALTHVFRFWHPFWVPLCLLSVDFEHFYHQWRRRTIEATTKQESSLLSRVLMGSFRMLFMRRIEGVTEKVKRLPSYSSIALIYGFGIVFFGYYLANLHWRLGEKHLNYPFSSMAFYSENRAIRPYNQHKYFPIYTGRIDSYETDDIKEPVKLWYRNSELEDNLFRVSTLQELRAIHKSASFKASQGLYLLRSSGEGYNRNGP